MKENAPLLEIIGCNVEDCILAEKYGADRIELCVNLNDGGISPPLDMIEAVVSKLSIPIAVMVRPRGGNFVYNQKEIQWMQEYMDHLNHLGVSHIVMGFLTQSHNIDFTLAADMRQRARDMRCTFHRAIDASIDFCASMEAIIKAEYDIVLTSGLASSALKGVATINEMCEVADDQIEILVGGGVRSANLVSLMDACPKVSSWHSSAQRLDKEGKYIGLDLEEVVHLKQKLFSSHKL